MDGRIIVAPPEYPAFALLGFLLVDDAGVVGHHLVNRRRAPVKLSASSIRSLAFDLGVPEVVVVFAA
jgi:hypothetical protein